MVELGLYSGLFPGEASKVDPESERDRITENQDVGTT